MQHSSVQKQISTSVRKMPRQNSSRHRELLRHRRHRQKQCVMPRNRKLPVSAQSVKLRLQEKGIAEAEAMEKKAEAYAKYNKAAVAEMMIKVLPDIAGKVAEPLGQIDKITIIGGGEGGSNGVDQIAGNVPVVMAKVFESMKEATGIDLADIINAESYDAKVNRNVNLSGLDSVNFVVKDDGTNVTMGKPQTKVNATAVEASAQGTGTASETTNQ